MKKTKILIFTGAGVSKESGLDTFRNGDNALWDNYNIDDVATDYAWRNNPEKVIDFYNKRRKEMCGVIPNKAHDIIASLEEKFDVTIVTQNVDNLHEKAGSTNVIHLHGNITKLRSDYNCDTKKEYDRDLKIGDVCEEGGQFRPDIVLFGENLDLHTLDSAKRSARNADICIVIGTSMKVSPANEIPWETKEHAIIYYIDPSDINFPIPRDRSTTFVQIKKIASEGIEEVKKEIEEIFL